MVDFHTPAVGLRAYNEIEIFLTMARGWASKAVEAQLESAAITREIASNQGIDQEQLASIRERENLMLSRVRVLHELESSGNPRYQQLLKKGLADLDARIRRLDQTTSPRVKSS